MNNIEELFAISDIYDLYTGNQLLIMSSIMVVAFYPVLFLIKKLIFPTVDKIITKRSDSYKTILAKHNISNSLFQLFVACYLMFWSSMFEKLLTPALLKFKNTIITVYVIITIASLLIKSLNFAFDIYKSKSSARRLAIGLHTHIIKIFIVICTILSILSTVIGIPISSLFTSIGAAAALLTFVFKDIVLGLLASLQLTFQNIIRVGDWISMPKYNADGDIEKITITVVVVRNFDNTSTTIPTSAFLTSPVRNWRSMFEHGGRRIKRAISIDMDTIKICNQKILDKFKSLSPMSNFAKDNGHLFDVKNGTTNLSMFRHYVEQYLKTRQDIHQKDFTFLVRQLDPTSHGIPIELYIFTKDTRWTNYEAIQAEIFDHLLGILPEFELRAFQNILKVFPNKS